MSEWEKSYNLSNFERITKAHVTGFDKLTFVVLLYVYICVFYFPQMNQYVFTWRCSSIEMEDKVLLEHE